MIKLPTSYASEEQQVYNTSESLEASVTSKEKIRRLEIWLSSRWGIFVGYSSKRKAYKCYNLRLDKVIERINVKIDEGRLTSSREDSKESDDEEEEGSKKKGVKKIKVEEQPDEDEEQLTEDEGLNQPTIEQEEQKDHLSPKS